MASLSDLRPASPPSQASRFRPLWDWVSRKLALILDPAQPLAERQDAWRRLCKVVLSLEPRRRHVKDVVVAVRKEPPKV